MHEKNSNLDVPKDFINPCKNEVIIRDVANVFP